MLMQLIYYRQFYILIHIFVYGYFKIIKTTSKLKLQYLN